MKKKNQEEFHAVEFQRQRRQELSDLYNSNPAEYWKQLAAVRKKFQKRFHKKEQHTA